MSVNFKVDFNFSRKRKQDERARDREGIFLNGSNGRTVILIHGLTGTPNEMKFLAAFLNRKGYSIVCPRLANHGEPLAVLKNTRWQDFYASVRNEFLKIKEGKDIIFAAGLSMGALMALLLGEEFQDRISGIICLSPTLFYDGWNAPWYRCFLPIVYLTPLKHFFYFKEDPPYGIKNERIRRLVHTYYSNSHLDDISQVAQYGYPYFPVSLLYQLKLLVKDLSKKLCTITLPVQLIQAQEDDITSVKNSEFIYHRIKSEKKEIVLLYDSYHIITADQERDTVARKMEEFFACICREKE